MNSAPQTKIAIVSGSLPPIKCGVGYYTNRLAVELHDQAPSLDFTLVANRETHSAANSALVHIQSWSLFSLWSTYKKISNLKPDIVHIQYPAVGYGRSLGINLLPYLLRLTHKAQVVVTLHEYHQSRWVGKLRDFITVVPAHQIVVSNQQDAQDLQKHFKNVRIIPLGSNLVVDPQQAANHDDTFRRFGLDPTRKTLYFFGFPFPGKRLEILLTAMMSLHDYQLLMMSAYDETDPYHQQLRAIIDKINTSGTRVAWTGFLDDTTIMTTLKPGGYFVLPQAEPLSAKSSTALTAAVQGQIVIAQAGPPNTQGPYVHNKNSVLISELSAENLAQEIRALDANAQRQNIIRTGAESLRNYFSWKNIVAKHLELYQEIKHETHNN